MRLMLAMVLALLIAARAEAAVEVGQPAPPLTAAALDGQTFDLTAARGRVVIVHYWATWCVPCRTEMPALDAFYRGHHAEGLEMIGISADRPRDRSAVVSMARAMAYPAATLSDAKVNGFGAPGTLPETFVIDRDGVVRALLTPDRVPVTEQSLAAAVLPLLGRKGK